LNPEWSRLAAAAKDAVRRGFRVNARGVVICEVEDPYRPPFAERNAAKTQVA
jgi:hypothetical protein